MYNRCSLRRVDSDQHKTLRRPVFAAAVRSDHGEPSTQHQYGFRLRDISPSVSWRGLRGYAAEIVASTWKRCEVK